MNHAKDSNNLLFKKYGQVLKNLCKSSVILYGMKKITQYQLLSLDLERYLSQWFVFSSLKKEDPVLYQSNIETLILNKIILGIR